MATSEDINLAIDNRFPRVDRHRRATDQQPILGIVTLNWKSTVADDGGPWPTDIETVRQHGSASTVGRARAPAPLDHHRPIRVPRVRRRLSDVPVTSSATQARRPTRTRTPRRPRGAFTIRFSERMVG